MDAVGEIFLNIIGKGSLMSGKVGITTLKTRSQFSPPAAPATPASRYDRARKLGGRS
ncbi:hypothetical protein H6G41_32625 [Tolypothrix sp. FACHB-123]|uniref:hypothetical protein n=1 Tax=Tolypothrix sp. FACHB-123 TaxID=2692868 RepID=UPI0016854446|nr:hypothetical protein [Tolypothrix sp. FACHB-123]MBD2359277.1 hypothetical protein [Tolypothrix sp. FACHB-123]